MDFSLIIELAINGALIGLMYALVALGIVLIYKTSGLANLAQGAIAMTGAYVTWAVTSRVGAPIWLAIPIALVLMFGIGMLIERLALRRMIGQPVIMALMLTLGIEIMLRGLLPGIFGSAVKRLDIGIPQAPLFVGDFLVNRATLIGGSVSLLVILLSLLFFNSRFGVVMRAVSDDQTASWSVGIRVERAIAILGGLDSIVGVLIAGLIVGIVESVATGLIDPLVGGGTRDIAASVIILLTLLVKPHGLFGREHVERV